jgi:hypothetical protein
MSCGLILDFVTSIGSCCDLILHGMALAWLVQALGVMDCYFGMLISRSLKLPCAALR